MLAVSGPDEDRLHTIADETYPGAVTFVHHPSNPLLTAILQRASVLVFAPIEDFGIIPVEAMAAGTPVLANAIGGAVESVLDGVTGAHVHDWDSPSELRAAVDKALASSPAECRVRAQRFGEDVFAREIQGFVERNV
ncbi:glycosyltransferase [Microbacterium sp. JZ37]|uniref:glycosyltransferase n=1 Tax=Microbacterium sp. JZ37 TaxID=2654193 RepID=UPI002B484E1E|nr:glycosyltransferase [Microbacterium sp. JZ37]